MAVVGVEASCSAAIKALKQAQSSAVIVTNEAGQALGIITERDIARRPEFRDQPDLPVTEIMSTPVETIAADDYIYQAIGRMRRARQTCHRCHDPAGLNLSRI